MTFTKAIEQVGGDMCTEEVRICSECGNEMKDGFLVDVRNLEYYCSKQCLNKNYTEKEYLELYQDNQAYWTSWEE